MADLSPFLLQAVPSQAHGIRENGPILVFDAFFESVVGTDKVATRMKNMTLPLFYNDL